jgi:hypothetical protein
MEASIFSAYVAASKLRRWLSRPNALMFIKECKELFDSVFAPRFKDSAVYEDSSIRERQNASTPFDLRHLVPEVKVALRAHVPHADVMYSRSSTHLGNSLIFYFSGGSPTGGPVAGSIKYIYLRNGLWRLAVQRQLPAPEGVQDPFKCYPHFPACLYSTVLSEQLEEVDLTWLVGHYARWNVTDTLCVVLTLSRVSYFATASYCNVLISIHLQE